MTGLAILLGSTVADAAYDSMITFGVGIHSGYFYGGSAAKGGDHRAVYGLNLRLRALRFLGVSMAYDLNNKESVVSEVNLPYPTIQFATHIYFLHVNRVTVNALVGLGLNLGDNNGSVLSSYILGGEIAVKVHKHVEVNAGFRFYLRSWEQVMNQRFPNASGTPGAITIDDSSDLKGLDGSTIVNDIFDFRNFQVLVSVRAYI